jgi:protein SCO1/2
VAAEVGGPWSLVDHRSARVTDRDFSGRFLLVYFGFTYCPDVCPAELAGMAAAIDALGPLGAKVTPLFITINPERDTKEKLAPYVASFHPRLIGLTGGGEEIAAAARLQGVLSQVGRGRGLPDGPFRLRLFHRAGRQEPRHLPPRRSAGGDGQGNAGASLTVGWRA